MKGIAANPIAVEIPLLLLRDILFDNKRVLIQQILLIVKPTIHPKISFKSMQ